MLKEIDIEDLVTLAKNNQQVTSSIRTILAKWDNIQK